MALKEANLEYLFPTPVLNLKIDGADELNKALLQEIEALREQAVGLNRSNQKGWHSEDYLFKRPEQSFKILCSEIMTAIRLMVENTMPGTNVQDQQFQMQGWINVNPNGALNAPHDHPQFTWSECYYVKTPKAETERSGNIEFLDPRTNMGGYGVKGSKTFATKVRLDPQAGSMLIFPSYVMHWVYPNDAEEERVSIAFNARMMSKSSQ